MKKMHKGHKKIEPTAEQMLNGLAAEFRHSWRVRLFTALTKCALWAAVALCFIFLIAAMGAITGALAWVVWLLTLPNPNFWYCWAAGSAIAAVYFIFTFFAEPQKE